MGRSEHVRDHSAVLIAAFVATSTCSAIRSDIEAANGLAVTLVHDISAPAKEQALEVAAQPVDLGKLRNLQQLAVMIRDIEMRAQSLSSFGIDSFERVTFELPIQVTNTNFTQSAVDAIGGYQRVRASARSVQERVSTMFGALSACLLPTLYAVLGACAYFLRLFEAQYKARTFTGREKTNARFLIAAIGDLVVGLFGNFGAGHEPGLSPLAVAFLAGYGVNVFFVFLDGLLQAFGRSNAESSDSAQRVLKS